MPMIVDKKTKKKRLRSWNELTPAMKKKWKTPKEYKQYTMKYRKG